MLEQKCGKQQGISIPKPKETLPLFLEYLEKKNSKEEEIKTTDYDDIFNDDMLDEYKDIMGCNFDYIKSCLQYENANDEIDFGNELLISMEILEHFPRLEIEDTLDSFIFDTKPQIEDFKLPYHALFIEKEFETEIGKIKGIYLYDSLEMYKWLLKTHNKQMTYMNQKVLQGIIR